MAHTQTQELTVQNIPLKKLCEDPANPRTVFGGIEELADSIKTQGLINPLTVRPSGEQYMIIAGARRYRAAKAAKVLFVPCIVRKDLDDSQVHELQIVENLQRDDIHPLDEAAALARLLQLHQGDYAGIAAKIGRQETYIRRRLALNNLIDPVREMFKAGKISKAHANLLCPLTAEQQAIMLKQLQHSFNGLPRPNELARSIQREFFLSLNEVPFDINDAQLVAAAGSCAACPKRTGNNPALFVGIERDDTCTDPTCYQKKIDVHLSQLSDQNKAKTGHELLRLSLDPREKKEGVLNSGQFRRSKPSECKTARKGIIVNTYFQGTKELWKILTVCADKGGCPTHFGPNAKISEEDDSATQRKITDQKKAAKIKEMIAQRREVAEALMEVALKPPDDYMLRETAKVLYRRVEGAYRKQIATKWYGITPVEYKHEWGTTKDVEAGMMTELETMNKNELGQFIVACVIAPEALAGISSFAWVEEKDWKNPKMFKIAEHYGLTPSEIKPEKEKGKKK